MQIVIKNNNRILEKDNREEVYINDNNIIEYTGIYYKNSTESTIPINHINLESIEISFIGMVECIRSNWEDGITGIYVKPLYIWNKVDNEWNKIINYKNPTSKYFLYPHLLMLPNMYYHYKPLYFLHTCENKYLDDFTNIQKTFTL